MLDIVGLGSMMIMVFDLYWGIVVENSMEVIYFVINLDYVGKLIYNEYLYLY